MTRCTRAWDQEGLLLQRGVAPGGAGEVSGRVGVGGMTMLRLVRPLAQPQPEIMG
jgi:ABC-type transport system involved in cytochrome c biogenesis ATPase subunit